LARVRHTPRSLSPRMVPARIAAYYCGLTVPRFRAQCPVAPVRYGDGTERYDLLGIDRWLDGLDHGSARPVEEWLGRLD
jgi:hypothetical protein